ncbi:MAG: response regulator [Microscillaceae bacterium]|jgi:CheY-like chemotaxis protein|nr:response regulator [Microscillaceae bacterium]
MTGLKYILLVDDDPINNLITKRKLIKAKPDIALNIVESASEALAYLQNPEKNRPQLILLDINMPDVDGWQFLQEFNRMDMPIKIIIYTSSIDEYDYEKSKDYSQIQDYIVKPLDEDKVNRILAVNP